MALAGKIAVITGARGKIAQAIAQKFVNQGAKVMLADASPFNSEDLAKSINSKNNQTAHGEAKGVNLGATRSKPSQIIKEAIAQASKSFGRGTHRLDIFFNDLDVITQDLSPTIDYDTLGTTVTENVESVLESIKQASAVMQPNKDGGCILCTGSTMAMLGDPVPSAYSISKAEVIAVVRAAAAKLANDNVRVNAISPHLFVAPSYDTAELERIVFPNPESHLHAMISKYVTNQQMDLDDVANAALYLASASGKSVTGHNLVLNGKFKFP